MEYAILPQRLEELKALDDDGSNETLRALLMDYLEAVPRSIRAMRTMEAQKKLDELKAEAHSLRSSSINIGAEALAKLCLQIETATQSPECST